MSLYLDNIWLIFLCCFYFVLQCLSFKALYDTDMKRIERCYTLFFRLMSASSVENEKEMEIEEFKRTGRPADSTITQGRSKKQKRQQVKT